MPINKVHFQNKQKIQEKKNMWPMADNLMTAGVAPKEREKKAQWLAVASPFLPRGAICWLPEVRLSPLRR